MTARAWANRWTRTSTEWAWCPAANTCCTSTIWTTRPRRIGCPPSKRPCNRSSRSPRLTWEAANGCPSTEQRYGIHTRAGEKGLRRGFKKKKNVFYRKGVASENNENRRFGRKQNLLSLNTSLVFFLPTFRLINVFLKMFPSPLEKFLRVNALFNW